MKKFFMILTVIFVATSVSGQKKSLYDFQAKTLDGQDFNFSTLKGKKVLVVNTASKCGLTPQYEGLQKLYEQYGSEDFVIVGFPANNFAGQEPGSNKEISDFCTANYGVTFQMMEKISVKGDDMHPLYQWLTSIENNGVVDAPVSWNFQKFLINENGQIIDFVEPKVEPFDVKITSWIEH